MNGSTFRERKAARKQHFERYVKGWKLRPCSACDGSGYYEADGSPPCGACDGTGKERYKPKLCCACGEPLTDIEQAHYEINCQRCEIRQYKYET